MEILLGQLVSTVMDICPETDPMQARMKMAGVLAAYDIRPAKIHISHPDIADKTRQFLSTKKLEGLSKLTLDGYAIELQVFGRYINKPVTDVTTNDIRNFLGQFDNLKLSTISRKLSVLKSFFGWLIEEEFVQKDPTRRIKPPKKEKRLPKALTVEELEIIRETCKTPRERAMIELFYSTGCRLSEIQQLDRKGIDWQARSIKVVGKGSKEREVFFSWKAAYHLKKYLNSRNDIVPALFITERQPYRRLSKRGFQREIKIIAQRAEIQKNIHPHVYRHTFATLTLNNGADLSAVQSLLGHSNPGTTQIYAQISSGRRKEQYQKFLVQ